MNIPDYNTTNCAAWEEYWDSENDDRFVCQICGARWPEDAVYYFFNHVQKPVCKKHEAFHQTYKALKNFADEVLGNDFNPLSVTIRLSEEGII